LMPILVLSGIAVIAIAVGITGLLQEKKEKLRKQRRVHNLAS
jgi:hypothetical protein